MKVCRHWIELDDVNGLFEYCRGRGRRCTCSGTINQCDYPEYFEERSNDGSIKTDTDSDK